MAGYVYERWYPYIAICAEAVEISEVLPIEISRHKSTNLHLHDNVFVASYDHLRTIWKRFEVKYLYFRGNRSGAHRAIWGKNGSHSTLGPDISSTMGDMTMKKIS